MLRHQGGRIGVVARVNGCFILLVKVDVILVRRVRQPPLDSLRPREVELSAVDGLDGLGVVHG